MKIFDQNFLSCLSQNKIIFLESTKNSLSPDVLVAVVDPEIKKQGPIFVGQEGVEHSINLEQPIPPNNR